MRRSFLISKSGEKIVEREEEEEGREEGGSMWRTLPVITFQKFDDLTGGARATNRVSAATNTLPRTLVLSHTYKP